ncbi:MAG TPA: hypothetical protein VNO30_09300 [Kofleriaceae bacterium]|nr:hypothetical protein [Kofleriaceae bacterium]
MQLDEGPRLVVYQSTDREGSTFSLSPAARRMLEARFGERLHASPRIFVAHPVGAHPARDVPERLHGMLARQLVMLLTGLGDQDLAQAGEIEFRDPVTDRRL